MKGNPLLLHFQIVYILHGFAKLERARINIKELAFIKSKLFSWLFIYWIKTSVRSIMFFQNLLPVDFVFLNLFSHFFNDRRILASLWRVMIAKNFVRPFYHESFFLSSVKNPIVSKSELDSWINWHDFQQIGFVYCPTMSRNAIRLELTSLNIRNEEIRIQNTMIHVFFDFFVKIFGHFNIIVYHEDCFVCCHFRNMIPKSIYFFSGCLNKRFESSIFFVPILLECFKLWFFNRSRIIKQKQELNRILFVFENVLDRVVRVSSPFINRHCNRQHFLHRLRNKKFNPCHNASSKLSYVQIFWICNICNVHETISLRRLESE